MSAPQFQTIGLKAEVRDPPGAAIAGRLILTTIVLCEARARTDHVRLFVSEDVPGRRKRESRWVSAGMTRKFMATTSTPLTVRARK